MKKILDISNPKIFTNKRNGQRSIALPSKKMKSVDPKKVRLVLWSKK